MKIDFESGHTVKRLAKRLQSRVEEWGDTLKYSHALIIVARMFGHDDYQDMTRRFGVADPSTPDIGSCPDERERRYRQYVEILAQNDFTGEEAETIVDTVFFGKWWGFKAERPSYAPPDPRLRAVGDPVEFLDERVVDRLRRVLKKSIKESGVEPKVGVRLLMARMFGHETFHAMMVSAAKGNPSVPDYYVSPEALDRRVVGYLSILEAVGFDQEIAMKVLQKGEAGWLGIEENEWDVLRQSRRADRLEHGWRPRWRPRRLVKEEEVPLPARRAGASSIPDSGIKPGHSPSRPLDTAKLGFAKSLALSVEELRKLHPQFSADVAENVSFLKSAKKRKDREPSARLLVGFIGEEESPQGLRNLLTSPRSAADLDVDKDEVGRAGPSSESEA